MFQSAKSFLRRPATLPQHVMTDEESAQVRIQKLDSGEVAIILPRESLDPTINRKGGPQLHYLSLNKRIKRPDGSMYVAAPVDCLLEAPDGSAVQALVKLEISAWAEEAQLTSPNATLDAPLVETAPGRSASEA